MRRPLTRLRLIEPFAQVNRGLEPDTTLVFDFEGEQWMINLDDSFDDREFHESHLRNKLRKPAGATGDVTIRIMEKVWDGRTLVKEYEGTYPVTRVDIEMVDVVDFDEAVGNVTDIVAEYIHEQGGDFSETYTIER